ncbi:MAG: VanZ family protein [Xanthomonadaceae bacterium]|jgi:VanZ family protein|nr:VanZ family protein [Xanthomonadaceae bacterium]
MRSALKPFHRPALWLSLWIGAIVTVIIVCLIPPPPLELPSGSDKIEHFLAYFLLAAAMIQIFAVWRWRLAMTIFLIAMGIGIEFAQGTLTTTRTADVQDAVANTLGVLAGLSVGMTPLRDALLRFDRHWFRKR